MHHNLSSPKIGQKGQEVLRQAEIKIVGNVQFSGKSQIIAYSYKHHNSVGEILVGDRNNTFLIIKILNLWEMIKMFVVDK